MSEMSEMVEMVEMVEMGEMGEMVDNARRITSAVDLPVIADADTGDGNQIKVVRCEQVWLPFTSKIRLCRRSAATW
jgi:2-methylisocitrate lyase-like PEP mutase family enzyme